MGNIQFKRILYFNGDLNEAIENLNTKLTPPLEDGEPLLCSYLEGTTKKFLLAIGTPSDEYPMRILPAFRNINEIDEFIKSRSADINLADQISTESDFVISTASDGKLKFNIKDDLKNFWINLNYE